MERLAQLPRISWPGAMVAVLVVMCALVSTGGVQAAGAFNALEEIGPPWGGQRPSLALDSASNPVVAHWAEGELIILHCDDSTCAGGGESSESQGAAASPSSLTLDSAGNPVVAYTSGGSLSLLHCNDANCAGGDESVTTPASGSPADLALALDGAGRPVVAYGQTNSIGLMHCNDVNCAGGDESVATVVTAPGRYLYLHGMSLDPAGYPVLSYADQNHPTSPRDAKLRLAHCNDVDCAGGDESITTPDPATEVEERGDLALDGSGNPVMSYIDSTNALLKVVHCNDADCAGGDESITSPGPAAVYPSLELDALGRPVMTYIGANPNRVRVMHCNDVNCAGGDETVAQAYVALNVSGMNALALDSSGAVVIAQRNWISNSLAVLRCADSPCVADHDGDGCADATEQALGPQTLHSEQFGGNRSAKSPYDYFNPTHDGKNRVDDIVLVVGQYFIDSGHPDYNPATDRTLQGPNLWNTGPPNGQQRVDDIVNQLNQYFHDCA